MNNPSLCDGIGYRTVLFLQGCDIHCNGCQNQSTWDMAKGTATDVLELAKTLRAKCFNKELTITGGEPLMQWEFIKEVISLIPDIHTAVETCGYVNKDVFTAAISVLDEIIMDIKLFDETEHIKYTGVSNKIIKENFLCLKASGKPFIIRTPLIAGKTDTNDNLERIKEFIGNSKWELLPENKLAKAKYDMLI